VSTPSSARPYHHGDLRSALITAAEHLLAEQAGWSFTLREVARAAGVSHNAPYNHFADRRALLGAVAARGFEELAAALREALSDVAAADSRAGIEATGCAYVAFALRNPARYRLMFSGELAAFKSEPFKAAGESAFAILEGLIAKGIAAGQIRPDPRGTHALAAWSLVHGLAMLLIDGKIPGPAETHGALTATVAATLLTGLATEPA
jgi:AcrR family transcriptional regulator